MVKVIFKNHNMKIKGLEIFGIIITTRKQLENSECSADELIINPTEEQLKKEGLNTQVESA